MTSTQITAGFLRQSAADCLGAKVLAAAIAVKCPKAQIVKARAESYGFCLEFYWSETFSEDFLSFIEEEMRVILKKEEIKIFEMMRDIAAEFLNFHHQKRKAKELKEWNNGLVKVIKVDTYVDLLEEDLDLEQGLEQLKTFKLITLESTVEKDSHGKNRFHLRIKGVSAPHQMALKDFIKKIKEANKYFHLRHSHLFSLIKSEEGDGFLWYPEGLKLKNHLLVSLKNVFQKQGYEEVELSAVDREFAEISCLKSLRLFMYTYDESTELDFQEQDLGLYSLESTKSLSLVSGYEKGSLESSLSQLIVTLCQIIDSLKLTSMVTFKSCQVQKKEEKSKTHSKEFFKKVLSGIQYPLDQIDSSEQEDCNVCLSFIVKDSFERVWEVGAIEIEDKKNPCYVRMSLISIERWVALLLDHSKSSLPQISLI